MNSEPCQRNQTPKADLTRSDVPSFFEREVLLGSGEWILPGTLTLPTGQAQAPGLVLVHGSGPQDRDETIGPNKPFRDLAWGLAVRGVAALRYEKRTREHRTKIGGSGQTVEKWTVQEEVIDDVLGAIALLEATQEVDKQRIFVLGHSLGGALIPRIGKQAPQAAGLIAMAGAVEPLEDAILRQVTYIFGLDPIQAAVGQAWLKELCQKVACVKDPNLSESTPSSHLPFGVPARYWLDLRGYHPPTVALEVMKPMLILQGERDYQITMEDFEAWRKVLSGRSDVTFKSYPGLNHLFIHGKGHSRPAEYGIPGHVGEAVVDEIANWIKSLHTQHCERLTNGR